MNQFDDIILFALVPAISALHIDELAFFLS